MTVAAHPVANSSPTTAENAPATDRKLLETVANLAVWAGYFQWMPEDSREVAASCIRWAAFFEREFAINVATGVWEEDSYIEEVEAFAMVKLKGVEHECMKALVWPVRS